MITTHFKRDDGPTNINSPLVRKHKEAGLSIEGRPFFVC